MWLYAPKLWGLLLGGIILAISHTTPLSYEKERLRDLVKLMMPADSKARAESRGGPWDALSILSSTRHPRGAP